MDIAINEYNQTKAVELGLCATDLIILRWFVNFANTERAVKRTVSNKNYYQIKYEVVLEDIPILNITKDTLYRRLKKLTEKGVLERIVVNDTGTHSFYRLGKSYFNLLAGV